MSERKPSAFVEDILKCIEHIQSYVGKLSFDEFSSNFMAIEACLYNIQIIGEAVSHLDSPIKEDNPQIPWTLMKRMRNRLIHEYFGTDLPTVWNVIKNELPGLEKELRTISIALQKQGK